VEKRKKKKKSEREREREKRNDLKHFRFNAKLLRHKIVMLAAWCK
jgi:hypothetical protein